MAGLSAFDVVLDEQADRITNVAREAIGTPLVRPRPALFPGA
jgi:hypothetical protein